MTGAVWILIDSRLGMEEIKMNQTYVTLNDGNKIPQFGLGVYMIPGDVSKILKKPIKSRISNS